MVKCIPHQCPGTYLHSEQINAHTSHRGRGREKERTAETEKENMDFLSLVGIEPSFTSQKQIKIRLRETETKAMVTRRRGWVKRGKGMY